MSQWEKVVPALDAIRWQGPFGTQAKTCSTLAEIDDRAFSVEMPSGCDAFARLMSGELGGQWWVGCGAVTWVCGRTVTWFLIPPRVPQVEPARRVLRELGIEDAPWTIGGCARKLLKPLGEPERWTALVEQINTGAAWGYHHVEPGRYPDDELWDLSSAHYQLLKRLPSPRLAPYGSRLYWHPLVGEAADWWEKVLLAIGPVKALRNAMVGAMMGSSDGATRYCHGEKMPFHGPRGPYRAAGLLVVRSCYELTALQATATASHYANTDCVMVPRGSSLDVWNRYSLPYRKQAEGASHVVALGVYRCGSKATRCYDPMLRLQDAACSMPVPSRLYHREWLAA